MVCIIVFHPLVGQCPYLVQVVEPIGMEHILSVMPVQSNVAIPNGQLHGEGLFAILNHGVQIRDKTNVVANVTLPDAMTSNGIVHIIDKVLFPQKIIDALH